MEHDLIYDPSEETVNNIEWDYLENAWVDNLGNIYKNSTDIPRENWIYCLPEHLRQYVQPIKPVKLCVKTKGKKII